MITQNHKTEIATPLQYQSVAKHWVFQVHYYARAFTSDESFS